MPLKHYLNQCWDIVNWTLGVNFSEILIGIQTFPLKKVRVKMSSGKLRPFCLGSGLLNDYSPQLYPTHVAIDMNGGDNIANPDSKVHGANMGSIWGRQDTDGPHVGPVNFAIWEAFHLKASAPMHFFFSRSQHNCTYMDCVWCAVWANKELDLDNIIKIVLLFVSYFMLVQKYPLAYNLQYGKQHSIFNLMYVLWLIYPLQ